MYFWGRNEYWMQIKLAWTKGGETMGENVPTRVHFHEKTKLEQVGHTYNVSQSTTIAPDLFTLRYVAATAILLLLMISEEHGHGG